MATVFHFDKDRKPYPVEHRQTFSGIDVVPATDPETLRRAHEILSSREAMDTLSFLRAVGAEVEFAGRTGANIFHGTPEEIAANKAKAREVGLHWIDFGKGSHTMRTIARIAFAGDRRPAVSIYVSELAMHPTDLPPGSTDGVITGEVSRYDDRFVQTGISLSPVQPATEILPAPLDDDDLLGLNNLDEVK